VEPEPVAVSNWYISLHGGIKFGEDWEDTWSFEDCLDGCLSDLEIDIEAETDNGWRVGGAVGWMFSEAFAIEAEIGYMKQDFDEAKIEEIRYGEQVWECEGDCSFDLDGDVSIFTGMVNFIAGFPVGGFLRPYVGVGGGFAHVSLNDVADGFVDDEDTSFAVQGFAGVDFGISEAVALGVRGRVVHIGDLEFEDKIDCSHDVDVDLIKSVEAVLTFGF
jgi:opacity protein-like surface antigen